MTILGRMSHTRSVTLLFRRLVFALPAIAFLIGASARAHEIELPDRAQIEDALPEGTSLTGREIWDPFLENRMHSAVQHQRVVSTDPGGGTQESRFWVRWKDFRDAERNAVDGVNAKTLIRFREPPDMRGTGFLMIFNDGRSADQFIYRPSSRQVRRIKLRGVGILGTDYTFDDIAFRDIEDADYHRYPDEEIDGVPVYVVESKLKPFVDSQYRTTIAYLEKDHYVILKAIYKDENDVSLRESNASYESIREFNGVWVPTESTMRNMKQKTTTKIFVEDLDANPEITENLFSVFRLALRR